MERRTFLSFLAATLLTSACAKSPQHAAIAPGATVLAFGDSVTHGTGAAAGEDWPSLLAALTGWRIVNAGIPGDTAEASKTRIQAVLDEARPKLVIIEIGGNDFLRRRPSSAVKEDIRTLIQHVKQSGAQVVLVAVPEPSLLGALAGKPSDAPLYAELGKEEGFPVIADVFSTVLGNPELRADPVHPNALGYHQMAAGILAALQNAGLAASAR